MSDLAERLAEHLYGHSREKAIEWAKEDKFDSCYRQAEDIIELLGVERKDAAIAELVAALKSAGHTFVYGDKIETIKIIESAIAKYESKQEGK